MESLDKYLLWHKKNGDSGYDPYDIVSLNRFTRSLMIDFKSLSFPKKVIRFSIEWLNKKLPIFLRRFLRIEKKIHPTQLGCMLHAYINLQNCKNNDVDYSNEIEFYKSELIKRRSKLSDHYAWGVPFSWSSSGVEFPEDTPFAVTANWIGSAFYELYRLKRNQEDLDILISTCNFVLSDLKRYEDERGICFSYSPVKKDKINNANLFAADLLLKVGKLIDDTNYIETATKAIDFSISTQLESGLIPYYADGSDFNDSYHGSYEMQCLYRAWKLTKVQKYYDAFLKYWKYYKVTYYNEDGTLSKQRSKRYPVDSTSLADALILFHEIKDEIDVSKEVDLLKSTLSGKWQDKSGYFYYAEVKQNKFVRIPYIRWTQGWMFLGLSFWYEGK